MAVAVFATDAVIGNVVASDTIQGLQLTAIFTKLPPGKHGFHIHVAGDLLGEGCLGLCEHWHAGPPANHGPYSTRTVERHTGDLGNIEFTDRPYRYMLKGVKACDLWGRSIIVHADEDDLGLGEHDDSKTTGHSGARIACAIIGRASGCQKKNRKTRKYKHRS
jgi:Cu-Zn family superoxide dismutase